MPTANTEEELILAGIIAFHFKKLKCRYRRSPRGGIVFEKSFLPGRPGREYSFATPPITEGFSSEKEDLSSSGRRKECVWSESISLLLERGPAGKLDDSCPEFQEKIGGVN
ncbi:hypothetical protein CDAR_58941 [Caerostris darwini]|uniref:Uncharacterized protein n=1 Tax=Caerostris darwini TaxID=1538125 RepID=A0AAV4X3M9_9ARAC|nr:hypothetical protein CDAR_58941 [Caerostris darwini]